MSRFAATAVVGVLVLGVSGPVVVFNEAARVGLRYEVLEPGEWVGKELPILEHIDIGERLKGGELACAAVSLIVRLASFGRVWYNGVV